MKVANNAAKCFGRAEVRDHWSFVGSSPERQGERVALKWKEICFHIDCSLICLRLAVKITTKCFSRGRKKVLKSRSGQASAAFSTGAPN